MKRFAVLAIGLMILTGCGSETINNTDAKTAFNREKYNQKIDNILSERLWNYNSDQIVYMSDIVADETTEGFQTILKASQDVGLDMTKAEGKEAVTAEVELLNIDRSSAGTAYIQFVDEEPVCGYYVYNDGEYSLKNKYPFEVPDAFTAVENTEMKPIHLKKNLDTDIAGYSDLYMGKMAVIDKNYVNFYEYNNSLEFKGSVKYDELMPMDAAIGDGYTAVLLGRAEGSVVSECSYEAESDEESYILKADCIQFVNDDGETVIPQLDLDLSTYTCVDFDGDKLVIGRDKGIDIYTLSDGQWVKQVRHSLSHFVNKIRVEDIDGDGVNEYVAVDDVNLYIYRSDSMPELLWCTNYDVGRLSGELYVGDINGDGVKEIYISDSNNVVFRYMLIEGGFQIYGGDVINGDYRDYIVGDFNGDDYCDYICSDDKGSYLFVG